MTIDINQPLPSQPSSNVSNDSTLIKKSSSSCDIIDETDTSRPFESSLASATLNDASTHATPYSTSTTDSAATTVHSNGDTSSKLRGRKGGKVALETLKPNQRKSNDLSGFTVDKLKFSSISIHGRDEEISIIQKAFDQSFFLSTNTNTTKTKKDPSRKRIVGRRHLICISGRSGTGKSKLVDSLEEPTKRIKGLLVRGKFDLNLRNEPYFAFSRAYSEICAEILERAREDPESTLKIQNHIKESLRSELALLTQIVPGLAEIIDLEGNTTSIKNIFDLEGNTTSIKNLFDQEQRMLEDSPNPSASSMTPEELKNRFQYAFLKLTRVISSHFKSFVLVLDDLQWADTSSLELLRSLILDHENSHLLIVGTYRSNEVANNPSHILLKALEELESKFEESRKSGNSVSFHLTQIHIENLGIDSVHKIIQDLLSTSSDDEKALRLAEICHKKTDGNAFYVLSFLAHLKEQNLLKYNFGTVSWTWDETEIESSTSAATNVVELLLSRINLLPPNLIELMKLASCLGSEFEVRIMELVWQKWTDVVSFEEEKTEESSLNGLKRLEQEGFIEPCQNKVVSSYRWAHDMVQEAGLSLIPESDRASYNRRIGEILLSGLQGDELDSIILVLVDLLNNGLDENGFQSLDESLRLARLNLQAGRKALSMSAFECVAVYAGNGIRLLPSTSWKDYYRLSLELYSLGAKAEGAIGNFETMNEFCQVVLSQKDMPTSDKFGVYNTWVDSFVARGSVQEATDILLSILREFKCTFPKNNVMVGLGLVKQIIKLQLRTKSKDFSKLNEMNDATRFGLTCLLAKLSEYFYMIGDDRTVLVAFRSLNWSIKYGSCEHSPAAIASIGMILTGVFRDLQGGTRLGVQALELAEKHENCPAKAKTIFLVHSFLLVWTKPAGGMIQPLLNAYEMCLQTGDTENAMWAVYLIVAIRLTIGSSLGQLEADALMYARQAKALKRDLAMYVFKFMHQVILNLMGQDNIEDPTQLIGRSVSKEDYEYCKQKIFLQSLPRGWPPLLLSFFGKHLELADSYEIDFLSKVCVSSPVDISYTLAGGVSCFAAARETGKKKYARKGRRILSKVKQWVEGGNPNVRHIDLFLEAESMAVSKKNSLARKNYESSILLAARSGFQNDAAFASERYGRFCLDVEKDTYEGSYRIREAIKYWESWGALAKVRSLEIEFPGLIQGRRPSQILCKPFLVNSDFF